MPRVAPRSQSPAQSEAVGPFGMNRDEMYEENLNCVQQAAADIGQEAEEQLWWDFITGKINRTKPPWCELPSLCHVQSGRHPRLESRTHPTLEP